MQLIPVHSVPSIFIASDGATLVVWDWPLPWGARKRGMVIIVHGLGEHARRYDHVAGQLNAWGFAVRSYDQCGHGESAGLPGSLPSDTRLLDDLADMVDSVRALMPKGTPVLLLGHSVGGLIVARFVALKMRTVDAVILSSPALQLRLNGLERLLIAVVPKFIPNLRASTKLKPAYLSHNPAAVLDYKTDPLVHDRVSARLARFVTNAGPAVLADAVRWSVPTLLMYAGKDKLIHPQGCRAFAQAAPKAVVTAVCFGALYHDIFNERDRAPVFSSLQQWLDSRIPPVTS